MVVIRIENCWTLDQQLETIDTLVYDIEAVLDPRSYKYAQQERCTWAPTRIFRKDTGNLKSGCRKTGM